MVFVDVRRGRRECLCCVVLIADPYLFYSISNNHDYGSFAEYILAKKHMQLRVPDNVTDEEAATLGVSVITVVCGFCFCFWYFGFSSWVVVLSY